MALSLQTLLQELDQLEPEEQLQVVSHLVAQLQHRAILISKPDQPSSENDEDDWDRQMASDLGAGKLNRLIAKAEADIETGNVIEIEVGRSCIFLNSSTL